MAAVRTTLAIDDDVLSAVRSLAEQQRRSIGDIVSELARQSLSKPMDIHKRNGLSLLPITNPDVRVTLEMVNALRDEAP